MVRVARGYGGEYSDVLCCVWIVVRVCCVVKEDAALCDGLSGAS